MVYLVFLASLGFAKSPYFFDRGSAVWGKASSYKVVDSNRNGFPESIIARSEGLTFHYFNHTGNHYLNLSISGRVSTTKFAELQYVYDVSGSYKLLSARVENFKRVNYTGRGDVAKRLGAGQKMYYYDEIKSDFGRYRSSIDFSSIISPGCSENAKRKIVAALEDIYFDDLERRRPKFLGCIQRLAEGRDVTAGGDSDFNRLAYFEKWAAGMHELALFASLEEEQQQKRRYVIFCEDLDGIDLSKNENGLAVYEPKLRQVFFDKRAFGENIKTSIADILFHEFSHRYGETQSEVEVDTVTGCCSGDDVLVGDHRNAECKKEELSSINSCRRAYCKQEIRQRALILSSVANAATDGRYLDAFRDLHKPSQLVSSDKEGRVPQEILSTIPNGIRNPFYSPEGMEVLSDVMTEGLHRASEIVRKTGECYERYRNVAYCERKVTGPRFEKLNDELYGPSGICSTHVSRITKDANHAFYACNAVRSRVRQWVGETRGIGDGCNGLDKKLGIEGAYSVPPGTNCLSRITAVARVLEERGELPFLAAKKGDWDEGKLRSPGTALMNSPKYLSYNLERRFVLANIYSELVNDPGFVPFRTALATDLGMSSKVSGSTFVRDGYTVLRGATGRLTNFERAEYSFFKGLTSQKDNCTKCVSEFAKKFFGGTGKDSCSAYMPKDKCSKYGGAVLKFMNQPNPGKCKGRRIDCLHVLKNRLNSFSRPCKLEQAATNRAHLKKYYDGICHGEEQDSEHCKGVEEVYGYCKDGKLNLRSVDPSKLSADELRENIAYNNRAKAFVVKIAKDELTKQSFRNELYDPLTDAHTSFPVDDLFARDVRSGDENGNPLESPKQEKKFVPPKRRERAVKRQSAEVQRGVESPKKNKLPLYTRTSGREGLDSNTGAFSQGGNSYLAPGSSVPYAGIGDRIRPQHPSFSPEESIQSSFNTISRTLDKNTRRAGRVVRSGFGALKRSFSKKGNQVSELFESGVSEIPALSGKAAGKIDRAFGNAVAAAASASLIQAGGVRANAAVAAKRTPASGALPVLAKARYKPGKIIKSTRETIRLNQDANNLVRELNHQFGSRPQFFDLYLKKKKRVFKSAASYDFKITNYCKSLKPIVQPTRHGTKKRLIEIQYSSCKRRFFKAFSPKFQSRGR